MFSKIISNFAKEIINSFEEMNKIYLLDLNYTLVGNQAQTRMLRPFSFRMEKEIYRRDLINAIRNDYVIIITARPDSQKKETMENILKKTGWQPQEAYFNDLNLDPPHIKESILQRFVLPIHGERNVQYHGIESNPKTREMYRRHGIFAEPYEKFIKRTEKTLFYL